MEKSSIYIYTRCIYICCIWLFGFGFAKKITSYWKQIFGVASLLTWQR